MNGLSEEFIIDKTLGRDIKFTLDNLPGSGRITKIQILNSIGHVLYEFSGVIGSTLSIYLEQLEVSTFVITKLPSILFDSIFFIFSQETINITLIQVEQFNMFW